MRYVLGADGARSRNFLPFCTTTGNSAGELIIQLSAAVFIPYTITSKIILDEYFICKYFVRIFSTKWLVFCQMYIDTYAFHINMINIGLFIDHLQLYMQCYNQYFLKVFNSFPAVGPKTGPLNRMIVT